MKSQFKFVVGIDISKKTFDVCLSQFDLSSSTLEFKVFANSKKGCSQFIKWLKSFNVSIETTLFCMENTGIYHRLLACFLSDKDLSVWVETGSQIKWSMGIQRGKTDKKDSKRIMTYACRHCDRFRPFKSKEQVVQQLADLLALRRRLQDTISKLKVPLKELKSAGLIEESKLVEKACRSSIKALSKDIEALELKIQNIINNNKQLKEVFSYITSVKSIGFIAACYLIVYTDCFTKFKSAKQIASYCGIAPFPYRSGTSIKGRTKVNHMANKNLKTILHMCAISSLAHNEEMKIYAARKVEEGKNKMLILNSIRNKLLSRVFSCVKNKKFYVPNIAA